MARALKIKLHSLRTPKIFFLKYSVISEESLSFPPVIFSFSCLLAIVWLFLISIFFVVHIVKLQTTPKRNEKKKKKRLYYSLK